MKKLPFVVWRGKMKWHSRKKLLDVRLVAFRAPNEEGGIDFDAEVLELDALKQPRWMLAKDFEDLENVEDHALRAALISVLKGAAEIERAVRGRKKKVLS